MSDNSVDGTHAPTQHVLYLRIGLKGDRRNIALVEENLNIVPFLVTTMKVLLSL